MLAKNDLMDTSIELQRINVGEQAVEEIVTETGFLFFVEVETGNQVLPGIVVNFDFHETWRRMSALADSHEVYPVLPSATRFVAAQALPCAMPVTRRLPVCGISPPKVLPSQRVFRQGSFRLTLALS